MRITDATPQADPAAPRAPETDVVRQARAVQESVAEAVSTLSSHAQGRDGLAAAQGPLAPVVQSALEQAGLLDGSEPGPGQRSSVAEMAVDVALSIADSVRRGDQTGAGNPAGQASALPLDKEAQTALDALVAATLQVLDAAEQGDYREAGAAYRASVGALESALGMPAREAAPEREERIISVAA